MRNLQLTFQQHKVYSCAVASQSVVLLLMYVACYLCRKALQTLWGAMRAGARGRWELLVLTLLALSAGIAHAVSAPKDKDLIGETG